MIETSVGMKFSNENSNQSHNGSCFGEHHKKLLKDLFFSPMNFFLHIGKIFLIINHTYQIFTSVKSLKGSLLNLFFKSKSNSVKRRKPCERQAIIKGHCKSELSIANNELK